MYKTIKEINKNLDFVNNLFKGSNEMNIENIKDLESFANNNQYLKSVYSDFDQFMKEKYTNDIKYTIENARNKDELHEIIYLFLLTAWISATITEIKKRD